MITRIQALFQTYKFVFLGGLLILIVIVLLLNVGQKQTPVEPPLLFTNQNEATKPFSTYLNTHINKTTDAEVAAFPNRKERVTLPDGRIQYAFPSTDLAKDNIVVTKDGLVIFKNAVTVLQDVWEHPKASSYINNYGKPEAEFIGSATYGDFAKAFIYASRGFAIIINPLNDEVFEVQSFQPTSVDDYLKLWGGDITNYKKESHKEMTEPL